jgi:hypothetical protein
VSKNNTETKNSKDNEKKEGFSSLFIQKLAAGIQAVQTSKRTSA